MKSLKFVCLLTCVSHSIHCSDDRLSNPKRQDQIYSYSTFNKDPEGNSSPKFQNHKNSICSAQSEYSDDNSESEMPTDENNLTELSAADQLIAQQQRMLHNSGQDFSDSTETEDTTFTCPINNLSNFFARCCFCFGKK